MLAGDQGKVFPEGFAEAVAGVDDDAGAVDAGCECLVHADFQAGTDEGEDFVGLKRRQAVPVLGAAACVHEDDPAPKVEAGFGHLRVPHEAADVVDDLDASVDCGAGSRGMPGVNGQDGIRTSLEDGFDDGQDAVLLLVGSDGSVLAWPGGFTPDVEDVRAFIEQSEGMGGGGFEGPELATVGEGVRSEVEDAHDEGARAEGECAGTELPDEFVAGGKGHTQMMLHSAQR